MAKTKPGISGELCRIVTEDGLELNGFYASGNRESRVGSGSPIGRSQKPDARSQMSDVARPDPNPQSQAPSPYCLVHVHGLSGNFYENRFVDNAAQACARQGIGFVSGNNRGHDYIADVLRDSRSQKLEARCQKSEVKKRRAERFDYVQVGGVYEKLADSVADIRAWIDFAIMRGAKRVILQGHSHGAIKVVHYLATTHDPRVCGLALLSPSDDIGWARTQLGQRFPWVLARARELVRAGKGRQLLPATDFPYPVSAATFFDSYNYLSITGMFNMSRTNRQHFPELAKVSVPVLLAVGTVEEYFVGSPRKYVDDIRACMVNCPSFTGAVIDGAPHNYLGYEGELAVVLERWLRRRVQGVKESRIRGNV